MSTEIENAWLEIEKENGAFCCEDHRRFYRTMFYSGAMAAMNVVAGWGPGSKLLCVNVENIAAVCEELTTMFQAAETEAAAVTAARPGTVRH